MLAQFFNKQGEVALQIATVLSALESGERIPNIGELSAKLNVGAGTVQTALKALEVENAIKLQPRGHQGTTLEYIDRIALWKLSGRPWISGSMPLPYTSRLEGLATAIYKQFERVEMPFNIQYMRGGKSRLQKLSVGAFDFAVCSKNAAVLAQQDYDNLEILFQFEAHSYMDQPAIVFSDDSLTEIQDGMRVGVDSFSYDHAYLNECVCKGKQVTFVPVKYSDLSEKLASGEIDVTLWNLDEIKAKFSKKNIHLIKGSVFEDMTDAGKAVIVIRSDDKRLKLMLPDILKLESIRQIQEDVIENRMLPSY